MSIKAHHCAYVNCTNSRRSTPYISFFSFPVTDDIRCRQWIVNSGNVKLFDIDNKLRLKSKVICERHFLPQFVSYSSNKSKRLVRTAVPIKFEGSDKIKKTLTGAIQTLTFEEQRMQLEKPSTSTNIGEIYECNSSEGSIHVLNPECIHPYSAPSRNYSNSDSTDFMNLVINEDVKTTTSVGKQLGSSDQSSSSKKFVEELLNMPSSSKQVDSPRKLELKKRIVRLKKTIKRKTVMNSRLRQKSLSFSTRNVLINLLENRSPSTKILVYMQLFHRKRITWTQREKQLALSLYYKSPGNYKFLLGTLNFVLPSISTIKSWLKIFNLKTGFGTKLIDKFKIKINSMENQEKECVLIFDEISLKKGVDHNKFFDVLEGYDDLGNHGRKRLD